MTWNDNASMYDEHLGNYRHELDKNKGYFEEIKDSLNDKSSEFEASNISNVEELKNWIKKTEGIVRNPKLNLNYHPESYIQGGTWHPYARLRGLEMSNGIKVIITYNLYPYNNGSNSYINIKKKKEGYKKIKVNYSKMMLLLFDIDDKFYYFSHNTLMEYNTSLNTETELVSSLSYNDTRHIGINETLKKVVFREAHNKLMIYDCKNKTSVSQTINQINLHFIDIICYNEYIYVLGKKQNSSDFVISKYDYNLNHISMYTLKERIDCAGSILVDNIVYILDAGWNGIYNVHTFNLDTFSYIQKKSVFENQFWKTLRVAINISGRNVVDRPMDDKFNIPLGNGQKSICGLTKIHDFKTETIQDLAEEIGNNDSIKNAGSFIDKKGNFNQLLTRVVNSDDTQGQIFERIFSI